MADHAHKWLLPEGSFVVIDTAPEKYPYVCGCGAFTHHPETGEPCSICAPEDYARRSTDLVTLSGGPFDGARVTRPVNQSVNWRCDPADKRAQKFVRYEPRQDDPDVWEFIWNAWTLPFIGRDRESEHSEETQQ